MWAADLGSETGTSSHGLFTLKKGEHQCDVPLLVLNGSILHFLNGNLSFSVAHTAVSLNTTHQNCVLDTCKVN